MSVKHLRLAAFAAERPENETWDEKRRAWNRAYPEPLCPGYNYEPEDRRNFHRDVLESCDRILDPGFRTLWEHPDLTGETHPPQGQLPDRDTEE